MPEATHQQHSGLMTMSAFEPYAASLEFWASNTNLSQDDRSELSKEGASCPYHPVALTLRFGQSHTEQILAIWTRLAETNPTAVQRLNFYTSMHTRLVALCCPPTSALLRKRARFRGRPILAAALLENERTLLVFERDCSVSPPPPPSKRAHMLVSKLVALSPLPPLSCDIEQHLRTSQSAAL